MQKGAVKFFTFVIITLVIVGYALFFQSHQYCEEDGVQYDVGEYNPSGMCYCAHWDEAVWDCKGG